MDRTKRAGRYLEWKVRAFAAGATLALGGMYLGKQWLVGVAIVVLAGGMALRFLPEREEPGQESELDDESESGDEDDPSRSS